MLHLYVLINYSIKLSSADINADFCNACFLTFIVEAQTKARTNDGHFSFTTLHASDHVTLPLGPTAQAILIGRQEASSTSARHVKTKYRVNFFCWSWPEDEQQLL